VLNQGITTVSSARRTRVLGISTNTNSANGGIRGTCLLLVGSNTTKSDISSAIDTLDILSESLPGDLFEVASGFLGAARDGLYQADGLLAILWELLEDIQSDNLVLTGNTLPDTSPDDALSAAAGISENADSAASIVEALKALRLQLLQGATFVKQQAKSYKNVRRLSCRKGARSLPCFASEGEA
jgi:hypothetical protein